MLQLYCWRKVNRRLDQSIVSKDYLSSKYREKNQVRPCIEAKVKILLFYGVVRSKKRPFNPCLYCVALAWQWHILGSCGRVTDIWC